MTARLENLKPEAHQISAIYEPMLPRQPMRLLLADDPGAGKTIMAGLLIKELLIQGELERCLIVAPGSVRAGSCSGSSRCTWGSAELSSLPD
ncbi:MAG: DEAD/DEAH box helicase family protein [Cyanobacteriota bacterium]